MCQLFETLKVINGVFCNIEEHKQRLQNVVKEIPAIRIPALDSILVPAQYSKGIYRCRIDYSVFDNQQIAFYSYQQKVIQSLQLVECDDVDYHLKYADRSIFDALLQKRGRTDEILIVKNGLITDTSYTNVVLFDGNQYVTPKSPLLKGTQRAYLLKTGKIIEKEIAVEQLPIYQSVFLINAMMDFSSCPVVGVNSIF
jgi:4-amino-4-deoxychorismate lyase